jgi:hypothetical protein
MIWVGLVAEGHMSTMAVRRWKSLTGQDLDRKLASLGLVLDREEKVIICVECK